MGHKKASRFLTTQESLYVLVTIWDLAIPHSVQPVPNLARNVLPLSKPHDGFLKLNIFTPRHS